MRFEFDPVKSASNHAKHGIDFIAAQAIWADVNRVTFEATSDVEPRFGVIGLIDGTLWTALVTYRHEETTIRIISVRRAREDERAFYDSFGAH